MYRLCEFLAGVPTMMKRFLLPFVAILGWAAMPANAQAQGILLSFPADDTRAITAPYPPPPPLAVGVSFFFATGPRIGNNFRGNLFCIPLQAGVPVQIVLQYAGPTTTWPNDDNYLYLYGPNGSGGWTLIAEDNDSGA